MVKKMRGQPKKSLFFQKFLKSSRTPDVMVPKKQKYQLKSNIFADKGTDVGTYVRVG